MSCESHTNQEPSTKERNGGLHFRIQIGNSPSDSANSINFEQLGVSRDLISHLSMREGKKRENQFKRGCLCFARGPANKAKPFLLSIGNLGRFRPAQYKLLMGQAGLGSEREYPTRVQFSSAENLCTSLHYK